MRLCFTDTPFVASTLLALSITTSLYTSTALAQEDIGTAKPVTTETTTAVTNVDTVPVIPPPSVETEAKAETATTATVEAEATTKTKTEKDTVQATLSTDSEQKNETTDAPIQADANKIITEQDGITVVLPKRAEPPKIVMVPQKTAPVPQGKETQETGVTKEVAKKSGPATLQDLYAIVANNHPDIAASKAGRDAGSIGVTDAYFGFLPRASIVMDKSWERQEVFQTDNPTYQVGSGVYDNYQRTIEVIQPIFDSRSFATLYTAYATRDQAASAFQSTSQGSVYTLVRAYLDTLSAYDAKEVSASEEKAIQAHLDEMNVRKRAGLVQLGDVSEVKARLETARAQHANAEAALIEAFASLEHRVGAHVGSLSPLASWAPMVPPTPAVVDDWIDEARRHNPDLKELDARARIAHGDVYDSFAEHMPRAELRYEDSHLRTGGSLYGGGSSTSDREYILRFTVPLFNVNGDGYTMFSARKRYKQALYQRDSRRFELEEQVKSAFSEVNVSVKRAAMLEAAVTAQKQTVAAKQERFRTGLASVTSVLDAERDYFQARRALLGARYNYLLNMMLLKRLAGTIAPEDLAFIDKQTDSDAAPVTLPIG